MGSGDESKTKLTFNKLATEVKDELFQRFGCKRTEILHCLFKPDNCKLGSRSFCDDVREDIN